MQELENGKQYYELVKRSGIYYFYDMTGGKLVEDYHVNPEVKEKAQSTIQSRKIPELVPGSPYLFDGSIYRYVSGGVLSFVSRDTSSNQKNFQKEIELKDKEISLLQRENDMLKRENAQIKRDFDELKKEKDALEKQLNELKAKLQS